MPSTRREFLAGSLGLAGALVTAGCIGDSPGGDTESPTDTPTEPKGSPSETEAPPPASAERTVGGDDVAVFDIVTEKAVTYQSIMGSGGVVAPEGRQFVVASVRSDAELETDAFSLDAGGESWAAVDPGDEGAQNYAVAGHEGGIVGSPELGGGDPPRYVAFELDSPLDAEEPRIVLERGGESAEWSLPDDARETLAASAPSFELDSLDAPESVQQGESMQVELTATNTSETDGRFLAAVYWPTELIADDDESHLIEESVDAGESVTASLTIDTEYTTGEDGPVTLRVAGYVSAEREITVENTSTPA
ncbi:hypothetical protein B4589_007185 [Halolamina sp. CBA1230]|uniref:hypothetical protein n=1 Tax=Halolamina sp. CBA1230 TaxID=1853690 RepID=UPI0009A1F212|nr:hypothetical protein [Halolamina sp. CBA1230]QKY20172.1 hypothetical protein B4589_007185 [Halolamina sp. CBA1230]